MKMTGGDNDRLRLQELEVLNEKRLQAQQRMEGNKLESQRLSTKRSRRVFQTGDWF